MQRVHHREKHLKCNTKPGIETSHTQICIRLNFTQLCLEQKNYSW